MSKYKKRADGRYCASLSINGKRKYFYSKSEKELDLKLAEYKINRAHGTISKDDKIRFKDYAESWYARTVAQKSNGTQVNIRNILDNHIYPEIGFIKIKDLKSYHIQNIVKTMVKKDLKDIVKRTVSTCKRILDDAMKNDVVYKNVAVGIDTPKLIRNEKKPLSVADDISIINHSLKHKYGPFILILRYTGIRSEEAVPLLIDDIDLTNKIVKINKAVTFIQNQPVVKETKNLKSRTVPIPDFIVPIISDLIEKQKSLGTDYVFSREMDKQKMLSKTALRKHLESFLYSLNKNRETSIVFTYHQLRHSYCTMLYYAGIKIKKAQELMGHSSADMVYNIYTHLDEEREKADQQINEYIQKTLSN